MPVSFFGSAPPLPTAKVGRCRGLIEIAQEKPTKVFPAHTLFLAKAVGACVETGRLHQVKSFYLHRPSRWFPNPAKKPLVLLEIQQYQRLSFKISEHCSPQLCKALFNAINTVPNGTLIVPGQLLRPMLFNEAKYRSGGGGSGTDAGYRQSDPYEPPAVRAAFVFPCFFQAVNLVISLWI